MASESSDAREAKGPVECRICPTVEVQNDRPLVTQNITSDMCNRRQEKGYHKCHKCEFHESARVKRELVQISMV